MFGLRAALFSIKRSFGVRATLLPLFLVPDINYFHQAESHPALVVCKILSGGAQMLRTL